MIGSWLYFTPGVIYSLIAGALVDKYGKFRLLVFFPIFGTMLTRIIMLINYAFLDRLPVEIFHLRSISSLFGGMSIYYLGYYGYGASISKPEDRAYRMSIFDGFEQVWWIMLVPYNFTLPDLRNIKDISILEATYLLGRSFIWVDYVTYCQ